jgi:CRISPR/Cas system-associated exonuclease Cas4 (RecB family)
MAVSSRGLKNIRTLSRRADQRALPYRTYMQITCLEMEKARRGAERRAASRRIDEVDARLREIEEEKQALLQGMAGSFPKSGMRQASLEIKAQPPRRGTGFRVRY